MFKVGDKVVVESSMAPKFNGSTGIVTSLEVGMVFVKFHEGHPLLTSRSDCGFYADSLRVIKNCLWAT